MANYYRMASGEPMQEIIGEDDDGTASAPAHNWHIMASGEPMQEIIGYDDEIGRLFHGKFAKKIGRFVKNVTRPIGRIPGVKQIGHALTQYGDIMLTPERLAAGAVKGLVTGGTKGLARGVKNELAVTTRESRRFVQNPVVRMTTKGAALLFPPLTPVAAGIEAANQVIKAVQSKDPLAAAAAVASVANTAGLASAGDEDALRALKTIKAVKDGALTVRDTARKAQDVMGTKFALPKGVTKSKAVTTAHALLTKAKAGHPIAQSIIKQTIAAAKSPGAPKNVVAGAKVLAVVHKAQQVIAKPGIRASSLRRTVGSYRKAARAAKGKSYAGAYLVDASGKVFKGNFAAK